MKKSGNGLPEKPMARSKGNLSLVQHMDTAAKRPLASARQPPI